MTVKESALALNIGDYYYSDGTWSSELDLSKTVVGVVFARVNPTSSDPLLAKDFPDCVHGLAIGLAEYEAQDFGLISAYSGHGYYESLGFDAALIVDTEKPNGYGNTEAHRAMNASRSEYCLLFNEADGVVAMHSSAVAAPASASAWYAPSYKEMSYIVENLDVINSALVTAGGTSVAQPNESEVSWDDNRSSDWYWPFKSDLYSMK